MIRVVAFDLDDTLWAVTPIIMRAEARLNDWLRSNVPELKYDVTSMRALRHNVLKEDPDLSGKITELRRRVIEESMIRSGIDPKESNRRSNDAIAVFLDARNQIELFDGALEVIRELSNSFVLGVLTNGNADVRRVGLGDFFNFAFSAEDVGAPKPDSALFKAALAHTATEPAEMVYVGDDPRLDVDPANRLGINTVWVRREGETREGETIPDLVVTHVREVPDAIRQLNTRNLQA